MPNATSLLSKLHLLKSDRAGHVAIIFALSIVPMLLVGGFAIDFQMTAMRKNKVQAVMDSAILAAGREVQRGQSQEQVRAYVSNYVTAQLSTVGASLSCQAVNLTFAEGTQDIEGTINCQQKTTLMQLGGREYVPFGVSTTSTWGIGKLDVAFMFDVSGSMNSNNRLTNLKASAIEAIDVLLPAGASAVVTEDTRLAMVTYNSMVNAGPFFEDVTGQTATRTYEYDIVTDYPDPETGDFDDDIIVSLYNSATDTFITEIGDGSVLQVSEEELENLTIDVRVRPGGDTSSGQVQSTWLRLSGPINRTKTENAFPYALFGDNRGNYHGRTFEYGDYNFQTKLYSKRNRNGILREQLNIDFQIVGEDGSRTVSKTITSTCVWERDGSEAFTAEEPGTDAYLSHMEAWFVEDSNNANGGYWRTGHPEKPGNSSYRGTECRSFSPVELTNNRTTLVNHVNSLNAGGGTAGHLGIAWSWYLVAEEWGNIFDGTAAPLPYNEPDLVKAVILMTDGEFNRQIFDDQGSSFEQAQALCDAMKLNEIVVYTVALQAPASGRAILEYCASGPDFYFDPNNGDELSQAYRAIATSLADLRIKS